MSKQLRTLHLTSPLMRGEDVRVLQQALAQHGWFNGELDGQYGPVTAQAVYRAKYWLGYDKPDHVAGLVLMAYLAGVRKQSPAMLNNTRARMRPSERKPRRLVALEHLQAKIGTKEHPAGSNISFASEWYGVIGPWCAMAVTWAYAQAGSPSFVRGRRYAYVPYIVADARAGRNGLALTSNPQPGDIVAYDWDGDGVADHVGLFVRWATQKGGAFIAVEGNTGIGNDSNGGEVMQRNRVPSQVQAFIHVGG